MLDWHRLHSRAFSSFWQVCEPPHGAWKTLLMMPTISFPRLLSRPSITPSSWSSIWDSGGETTIKIEEQKLEHDTQISRSHRWVLLSLYSVYVSFFSTWMTEKSDSLKLDCIMWEWLYNKKVYITWGHTKEKHQRQNFNHNYRFSSGRWSPALRWGQTSEWNSQGSCHRHHSPGPGRSDQRHDPGF